MQEALIFSGILNLIMVIVFLVMAGNISSIKKMLQASLSGSSNDPSTLYINPYKRGALKEFQGKKAEALDCYMEALFYIKRFNPTLKAAKDAKETHLKDIKAKIEKVGGTVPE